VQRTATPARTPPRCDAVVKEGTHQLQVVDVPEVPRVSLAQLRLHTGVHLRDVRLHNRWRYKRAGVIQVASRSSSSSPCSAHLVHLQRLARKFRGKEHRYVLQLGVRVPVLIYNTGTRQQSRAPLQPTR
jgi:hypothetical protein